MQYYFVHGSQHKINHERNSGPAIGKMKLPQTKWCSNNAISAE